MISSSLVAGILVGHGELPAAIHRTIEKIIGTPDNFQIVSNEDCSAGELKNRIVNAIQNLGNQNTIIFVDLFGGSCSNVSNQLLKQSNTQKIGIICGVNIATLIKFFQYRDKYEFSELLQILEDTGKAEIKLIKPK
jgi:mannose/fructose-specific phosphotransferase system component IIA